MTTTPARAPLPPQQGSTTPVALKHRRHLEFDFSDVPAHWMGGSPLRSHFLNALSLVAPPSERHFVRVMRDAKKLIPTSCEKLHADMTGFIQQEAMHARVHKQFNDHLGSLGYDLAPIRALYDDMFAGYARYSTREQLTILAAGEHYTYVFGKIGLETRYLDDAHPSARRLWLWHAMEEIEHQSVAFDVARFLGVDYLERIAGLRRVQTSYAQCIGVATRMLIHQEDSATMAEARKSGKGTLGLLRDNSEYAWRILRESAEYVAPRFRPWHGDKLPSHLAMLERTEALLYRDQPGEVPPTANLTLATG